MNQWLRHAKKGKHGTTARPGSAEDEVKLAQRGEKLRKEGEDGIEGTPAIMCRDLGDAIRFFCKVVRKLPVDGEFQKLTLSGGEIELESYWWSNET
jgi:hypothetical protein